MIPLNLPRFLIVTLALLGAVVAPAMARTADHWSCRSNGFRVAQTGRDIVAGADNAAAPAFSAQAFAAAGFAIAKAAQDPTVSGRVTMERRFRIVSLIGPLLALRDDAYVNYAGTAHPGGETRFWTIDLRRTGPFNLSPDDPFTVVPHRDARLLDLRALVTPAAIHAALGADSFVRQAVPNPAGSLDALLQQLSDGAGAVANACFSVPSDLLTRFAIIGLDRSAALVRIGLPGMGPCRYNLTQLGLRLALHGTLGAQVSRAGRHVCVPPTGLPALTVRLATGS